MGVGQDRFLQMALKELLDNAIDAAETAAGGAVPWVKVRVDAAEVTDGSRTSRRRFRGQ
jgi:DNA topoisomerase VI subunit B